MLLSDLLQRAVKEAEALAARRAAPTWGGGAPSRWRGRSSSRRCSAAVAEAAAAALVGHEAARRVDPEMAATAFDKAFGLDPLAEGLAKGAAAGDPLRGSIIARNMPDQAAIQQQQFAEVLEARAKDKKALAEALSRVRELELSAAAALELSAAAAGGGEQTAGGGRRTAGPE